MNHYKNVTEQILTVAGLGVVKPGEVIESEQVLESANLELVDSRPETVPATAALPAPAAPVAPALPAAAPQINTNKEAA